MEGRAVAALGARPSPAPGKAGAPAKVLIVQPLFAQDRTNKLRDFECLSVGYLTAALRAAGIAADPLDAHLARVSIDDCVDVAARNGYTVVGISCAAQRTLSEAVGLARALKVRMPSVHVTAGGQFVSHVHEQVANLEPSLDSLVRGEGEYTFAALIRRVERGESLAGLPGVTFREQERVVVNPPAPRIADLDALPFPDRSYMPSILYEALAGVRFVSMLASRGCVYQCTFCSVDRPRVVRSPANVVAELREIHQRWGVWRFMFNDDLLVGATPDMQAWAEELADHIVREVPHLDLWGMTRADAVTPRLASRLRDAGFRTIFVGVESASDRVLRRFKKGTRAPMNERAIRALQQAGIRPEMGFIMLEPHMVWDDLGQNLAFLRRVGCFSRHNLTNRLNVYHGAPMYEAGLRSGDIDPSDDLTARYPYEFDDPRVALYSELMDALKRVGLEIKQRVSDAVERAKEVQAELCRQFGTATRDWPLVGALREQGRGVERMEADRWLLILEELYARIDQGGQRETLIRIMSNRAHERLDDVAAEVERLTTQVDDASRRFLAPV